ncbi:MAG TPA: hypothetical protein VGM29_15540 [Polyangiaceae bacterium]|jgi:hypothetical protein
MPHASIPPKIALTLLAFVVGCQASMTADTSVNTGSAPTHETADENAIYDKPVSAAEANPSATPSGPQTALLGARHDLTLDGTKANVACACMKVGLGTAQSAAFQWRAGVPLLDDTTELVVALTPDGSSCKDEPKGSAGPSYSGYRLSGNDVIVLVEDAQSGRPQVAGAIIPKPVGDGQVFMAPAHKKLPYGAALNDPARPCKVGNVSTKRTQPFAEDELGEAPIGKRATRDSLGANGESVTHHAPQEARETDAPRGKKRRGNVPQ